MKNRDTLVVLAILALIFWPKRSTSFQLSKTCVFPDGATTEVPLGTECPFDAGHGGQSYLTEFEDV